MPPDMNPLESNLTSRMHKRNKSSVSTASDSLHRISTPLEGHRRSGDPYETLSRPPSMPFMHTRQNSGDSFVSSKRDSRTDLPSRQYQIPFGNNSRHSVATFTTAKTAPPSRGSAQRGSYAEVPLGDAGSPRSAGRPKSMAADSLRNQPINASPTRLAKFTESWYATESLVNRTQQRQRAENAAEREQQQQHDHRKQAYESLTQRYENAMGDSDDENYPDHDMMRPDPADDVSDYEDDSEHFRRNGGSLINASARMSGNEPIHPLRSHPSGVVSGITSPSTVTTTITSTSAKTPPRQKTPFRGLRDSIGSALSEVSPNSRPASGGGDIVDAKNHSALSIGKRYSQKLLGVKNNVNEGNRISSIQADQDFFSTAKPYGQLRAATPPVMLSVDNKNGGVSSANRQVSSGNDYDLGNGSARASRRHVSGKAAEEGMAGSGPGRAPYSRYSALLD